MPPRRAPRPRGNAVDVAPTLLGRVLARRLDDGTVFRAKLVEVEAYEPDDPASHSFRGPTARNAAMFGPPGHLYVYLIYGMHHCMNVTTGPRGRGSAVLLRAAEPIAGLDAMRRLRPAASDRDLCRGPGRLAKAFGVDRALDGLDLLADGRLWLEAGTPLSQDRIATGPRVGVRHGTALPWRYWERDSPYVSAPPSGSSPRGESRPSG